MDKILGEYGILYNILQLLSSVVWLTSYHELSYGRCNKLVSSALRSNNSIVRMVYSVALNNCRNFAGYNRRYGYQSVDTILFKMLPPLF